MTHTSPSVLIVEDEALLLFSIADNLRDAGFNVFEATNAAKAITLLEAHAEISILFTDVDMPGSMDGLRLSALVRDRWPPVKIIITSGKLKPDAHGMPDGGIFLPKPYVPATVTTIIQQLLS